MEKFLVRDKKIVDKWERYGERTTENDKESNIV